MEINVQEHHSGPMFDERGPHVVAEFTDHAVEEVAQTGKDMVDNLLAAYIRNPTPYYQTRIQIERAGSDRIINDGGVIYGPWLEGVGSKNRTTRFKGYFSFRQAKQQLDRRASSIINGLATRYLRRLE